MTLRLLGTSLQPAPRPLLQRFRQPVLSENANGAEISNPRGVAKFAETSRRGTGSAIGEPELRPLLQTIRSVQLARPNSYAASRW